MGAHKARCPILYRKYRKEASELSCLIFFHPQRDPGKGHAVTVVTVIQSDCWSLPPNINQAYTWMVLVGWVNSTPLMHLHLSYYWEIIIEAAGLLLTRNPINSPQIQGVGCQLLKWVSQKDSTFISCNYNNVNFFVYINRNLQ